MESSGTEAGGETTGMTERGITIVTYSLGMGGAERVLVFLANALAAEGALVRVLTFTGPEGASFYPVDSRVRITALGIAGKGRGLCSALRSISALRAALRAERPRVALGFMHMTGMAVLLAALGTGIKVVACERTDPWRSPRGRWLPLLRRLLYRQAQRVVVQNRHSAGYFAFLPRARVRVIPNPVFPPPAAAAVTRDKVIVGMGRFIPVKRFDLLIRAFHAVSGRMPGWSLVVHGEGRKRRELEALAAELGLGGRVSFPGVTRDPHSIMRRASIFALTSDYEGFPNALCEAMACGMAVVASDCGAGLREIVRHGEDGLLVPPGDAESLAKALLALAGDTAERERLGANAARLVERFPADSVREQWRALLAEAVGVPRHGGEDAHGFA